mgnify:CR=1 FL=1
MSNEKLFNVLNENIKQFGIDTVSFMLSYYNLSEKGLTEHLDHRCGIEGTVKEAFDKCVKFIDHKNIDQAVYLLQCDTNYLYNDFNWIDKSEIVTEKIFQIVERLYDLPRQVILDDKNRDGKRIYASGSVIHLMITYLNFSVADINKLTKKNTWAISRHKNKILKLDFKHPRENSIFKKHLKAKELLIDFILNYNGKEK